RRTKQVAHNLAAGITPVGVAKKIKDIIEGIYNPDAQRETLKAAQDQARYAAMSEKQMTTMIKKIEKQMLDHAKNLEFEKAAQLRDELKQLKQKLFLNTE
ncbi:MAG: UvrB/UvrC motif-containing protein, partial [Burkholderiales bacterium]